MKTSTRFALVLLALLALIFAPAAARAADAAVEPATTRPPADARAPRPLAKLCESCEAFVENGEAFLNDPATQEKFQAYAVKACETAGKDKNMCEQLIASGIQSATQFINDNVTPQSACDVAGFCARHDASKATTPKDPSRMSRFLSRAVVAPAPPRPGPGADCLKCKFAVESLHAAVSSPDAITQLIAQADDLCDKYAAQFELDAECEAAVEKYGPSALTKASAVLADPARVCAELEMCPAENPAASAARANPLKPGRGGELGEEQPGGFKIKALGDKFKGALGEARAKLMKKGGPERMTRSVLKSSVARRNKAKAEREKTSLGAKRR